MGAKLFIGTPGMRNEGVLKRFWYGLCENAWFPWQPIADSRMVLCLQKVLIPQLLLIVDYKT